MRIAIISDIHSNLEALTTAMDIIDKQSVHEIVCLGDIIGYGANPNECLDLVRRRCKIVLMGNHEEAVLDASKAKDFTQNARFAIEWTRHHVDEENLVYLRSLPLAARNNNILYVHASPCEPGAWDYIFEEESASHSFRCFSESLCFIGHTHIPAIFSINGYTPRITRDDRFLVNVGSIGQPRDRNTQLSFGMLDTDTRIYENIRAPYDVETAVKKIMNSDLPVRLGQRLLMGV
jgi:diadenosine tetraphosphatase ApaH/serine/threonine PP2A family protein phosphatase